MIWPEVSVSQVCEFALFPTVLMNFRYMRGRVEPQSGKGCYHAGCAQLAHALSGLLPSIRKSSGGCTLGAELIVVYSKRWRDELDISDMSAGTFDKPFQPVSASSEDTRGATIIESGSYQQGVAGSGNSQFVIDNDDAQL